MANRVYLDPTTFQPLPEGSDPAKVTAEKFAAPTEAPAPAGRTPLVDIMSADQLASATSSGSFDPITYFTQEELNGNLWENRTPEDKAKLVRAFRAQKEKGVNPFKVLNPSVGAPALVNTGKALVAGGVAAAKNVAKLIAFPGTVSNEEKGKAAMEL